MSIKRPSRGFTLIEIILFIVILGIGLVSTLAVFQVASRTSADPVQPKQAMLVAESMMEEILLKPYTNPSGGYVAACASICDRSRFDDVSDYNGYTSKGVYGLDDLTTPIQGLGSYNVAVAVANATLGPTGNGVAGLRITVTVSVNGASYPLTGYRFNYD